MGKENGKKGRKEPKSPSKTAAFTPKLPGIPKPPNLFKHTKNLAAREKKAAAKSTTSSAPVEGFEDPMGRLGPFTKNPQHAKWPALFRKHLGLIESHIKGLDRIMQAMRADMLLMPEGKEKLDFELGERGNWRCICAMMDQSREVLASARETARGVLPQRMLDEQKGTGVSGTTFERLVPQLVKKAAELGYDPTAKGTLGHDPNDVDTDGDSEMTDSSDSDSDSNAEEYVEEGDKVAGGADFVSLNIGSKIPGIGASLSGTSKSSAEDKENEPTTNSADPSPLFFVDTEGTPVNISTVTGKVVTKPQMKKEKKAQLAEARAEKKASRGQTKDTQTTTTEAPEKSKKRKAKTDLVETEPIVESEPATTMSDVDFVALQASLQAEVEAATKAQEAAQAEEKKSRKKRRRSSGADAELEVVEKKLKKEKEEKGQEKKRKIGDSESASVAGVEGGEKKKRKHEATT